MSVSKVICEEILSASGIQSVFGVPGAYSIHLIDRIACASEVCFVLTSHEAGAAFAAQAYGQVCRSFGVCITTAGPAVTNCITPLLSAKGDCDSVLLVHGEIPSELLKTGHLQDFSSFGSSVEEIMKQVCYTQHVINAPELLCPETILRELSDYKGGVSIQVPSNVFSMQVQSQECQRSCEKVPEPTAFPSVIQHLTETTRPILCFVGHGVYRTAMKELDTFLKKSGLPVITTARGVACVDHSLENYLGQYSIFPHETATEYLTRVEKGGTILCLGASLGEFGTCGYNPLLNDTFGSIIHIDRDPQVFGRLGNIKNQMNIVGDLSTFLRYLNETIAETIPNHSENLMKEIRAGYPKYERSELLGATAEFLSGQRVAYQVGQALQRYDIVNIVADTGSSKLYAAHYIPYKKNWRCIMNSGVVDCLGFGLSASVGAARGSKDIGEDAVTVAIVGDGGVLMNNELNVLASDTMDGISLLVFILNDYALSYVHQGFAAVMGRPLAQTRFPNKIDFNMMAKAFGIHSEIVKDINTIDEAFIQKLVALKKPVVIDCRLEERCIGPGLERYNHVRQLIGKEALSASDMAKVLVEHKPEVFNGGGPNRMHLYGIIYDVFRGCIDPTLMNSDNSGVMPKLSFGLGVSSFERDVADIGDAVYFEGRFFVRRTDDGESRNNDGSKYSEGTSKDYRTCYSIGITSLRDMVGIEYVYDGACNGKKTMRDMLIDFIGPERQRGDPGRIYGFVGILDYQYFLGTSLSKSPTNNENILPIIDEYARPSIPTANLCGLVCGFVRTVAEEWDDEYSKSLYERMFYDNPRDNDGTTEISVEMGTYWISHTHGIILDQQSVLPDGVTFELLARDEDLRDKWLHSITSKQRYADCGHVIPSTSLNKYFFIKYPIHHVDVFNPPLQVGISTLDHLAKTRGK